MLNAGLGAMRMDLSVGSRLTGSEAGATFQPIALGPSFSVPAVGDGNIEYGGREAAHNPAVNEAIHRVTMPHGRASVESRRT